MNVFKIFNLIAVHFWFYILFLNDTLNRYILSKCLLSTNKEEDPNEDHHLKHTAGPTIATLVETLPEHRRQGRLEIVKKECVYPLQHLTGSPLANTTPFHQVSWTPPPRIPADKPTNKPFGGGRKQMNMQR